MEIPRGQLNEEHLEFAKNRLESFSAILILENLSESLEILDNKFGWKIPNEYKGTKKTNSASRSKLNVDVDKIEELTTFDDELYAFGIYLNRKQLENIKHRRNYGEKYKNCANPCCGRCAVSRFTKK